MLDIVIALRERGLLMPGASVAEIGAQQLTDDFLLADTLLGKTFSLFGAARPHDFGRPVGFENFAELAPWSRPFWRALGCSYLAIDLVEGEDVASFDLNRAHVPRELKESQDLVVNGGTTEHILNQENVFRFIHDLTKPRGIMVHLVPCQGTIIHGFFQYTQKFFSHLCRENGYMPLVMRVSFTPPKPFSPMANEFGFYFGAKEPLCDPPSLREGHICAIVQKLNNAPFVVPTDVPAPNPPVPGTGIGDGPPLLKLVWKAVLPSWALKLLS